MIPGRLPAVPRRRSRKVLPFIVNGQTRGWDAVQETHSRGPATWWQFLLQSVLPAPASVSQRLGLSGQVLADFLLITVGFTSAKYAGVFLRSALRHPAFAAWDSTFLTSVSLLLLCGSLFTLLGYSERLYHPETARDPGQQILVLAKVTLWSTILVSLAWLTAKLPLYLIVELAAAAPVNFTMMWGYRRLRQRTLTRRGSGTLQRNLLIIGAGPLGRRLARTLKGEGEGLSFRGFLDPTPLFDEEVLGSVHDLAKIARSQFIDEIILAVPPDSNAAREAIWQARHNCIDVKLVPDLLGADPAHVTLEKHGNIPLLTLSEENVPQLGLLLKRMVDVVLSAGALVLAAPLMAAIALAIRLDSCGPVLYCAPRLGLKGQRFLCYKFRSMVTDADRLKQKLRECNEREGAFFKIVDDPRITRIGKFLRRYSLDELPQLWNVLRGDMSLVGPRPHPLDDAQNYQPEDLQRLGVTPGLTGLWQVTARRDPSFERSMALDREYIARWSLRMDFQILRKTVSAVFHGEGT